MFAKIEDMFKTIVEHKNSGPKAFDTINNMWKYMYNFVILPNFDVNSNEFQVSQIMTLLKQYQIDKALLFVQSSLNLYFDILNKYQQLKTVFLEKHVGNNLNLDNNLTLIEKNKKIVQHIMEELKSLNKFESIENDKIIVKKTKLTAIVTEILKFAESNAQFANYLQLNDPCKSYATNFSYGKYNCKTIEDLAAWILKGHNVNPFVGLIDLYLKFLDGTSGINHCGVNHCDTMQYDIDNRLQKFLYEQISRYYHLYIYVDNQNEERVKCIKCIVKSVLDLDIKPEIVSKEVVNVCKEQKVEPKTEEAKVIEPTKEPVKVNLAHAIARIMFCIHHLPLNTVIGICCAYKIKLTKDIMTGGHSISKGHISLIAGTEISDWPETRITTLYESFNELFKFVEIENKLICEDTCDINLQTKLY